MFDKTPIELVLERSERILEGAFEPDRTSKFASYAVTNFRGGIGKSTLARLIHEPAALGRAGFDVSVAA